MGNIILDNISLILLLPLWIFLIIMCGRFFSVYVNKRIIYFLTLLSSLLGAGMCGLALINLKEPLEWIYQFIKINDFSITFGLRIDKLSLIISLLLFVISFAVQIFSVWYMKDENKNYKFFALLNLFNFSMASLLFSPNLFQFYIFWELVGIVSYLLIGFEYKDIVKSEASRRVFLINRVGDTALISGIILISYYMFSYVNSKMYAILSFDDFNAISALLTAYAPSSIFYTVCGLFILAAAVKSAQFPFYTWLQDAMEAKIPVSALLHSATMVVAGVYLIIRMMPFFTLSPILLKLILLIGLLTAVICSILASLETIPKKVLAYSTSANLGLMFAALGFVNIKAAIILLTFHAFIKSSLFLLLPKDKQISKISYIFFLIASLTLAGLILCGIGAKELLYNAMRYNQILTFVYFIICFATGFYIIRLAGLLYKNSKLQNNANIIELTAAFILLLGNISLYFLLYGTYHIAEPYAASIGGSALAIMLWKNNKSEKFNQTPKILEKFYGSIIPILYNKFTIGLNYIENNVFSNYKPILSMVKIPVIITNWIEINIMNKSVNFVKNISKELSKQDMVLQSQNVQTYNAYAFIIVTIIITIVITGYTLIFR